MRNNHLPLVVLGGGVTGLAAAHTAGCPVLEREDHAGGICSSYYMRPGSQRRETAARAGEEAYRFEHGGGHWIFGGHPDVLAMIEQLAPCERIERRSSVYFADEGRYVGFPLQYHLRELAPAVARAALAELREARTPGDATMAGWLAAQFGPTLGALFFAPFHESYTAGLWRRIAPQDGYKTPLDLREVEQGAVDGAQAAGYNVSFLYPRRGLDALIGRLAGEVDLRTGHEIVRIDPERRELALRDGSALRYERLLSTLPLNRMLELTGLALPGAPAPHTSVLVLNIGARRGPRYPADHWLYIPRSASGFHRVGFYSNVAEHFVPAAQRGRGTAACLYVERSFAGGDRPPDDAVANYSAAVVRELQDWGFIAEVDACDPTWVDVAYTWNHPGSTWIRDASAALAGHGIRLAGRYARWSFQGIADSLRDGYLAGLALRAGA